MRALPLVALALAAAACQPSVEERAAAAKDVIDGYCTDCHNDAERTGELTLERLALTDVGAHAEVWETVVRKLRGRMMPPAGEPLPEAAATDELVAYLEQQLDAAAAANPNPGRKSLHRLNRTEYGNAIRDLLALDIDASAYLPNDSEAYGFDNIADVLGTDPSLMDRYLSAAWKITSAAIGDTDIAPAVATYRVPPDRSQSDHVEGLPFGTRGGMLVSHYFPVDGEYVIRPRLWRNTVDVVRGTETPHDLEVSLDGAQLSLTRFGGPDDEVPAQMFPGKTADEIDRRFETRVVVEAGQHDVGVTFAKKSSATRQDVLQAFQREKHDARMDVGIPELDQLVIEGPLTIAGPGRSASRERIFSCEPAQESEAAACAERILTSLARRAYRRPITDDERGRLLDLYGAERAQGRDFEAGVQTALAYILVVAAVPVPRRAGSAGRRAGHALSHRRPRARVAAVVLLVGQLARRRAHRRRRRRRARPAERARAPSRAHAGRRARDGARARLRGAVALSAQPARGGARHVRVPGLRRQPAPERDPRDGALVRDDRPRGPAADGAPDGRLHVHERAAREALRRAGHLRRPVPPRRGDATSAATACSGTRAC